MIANRRVSSSNLGGYSADFFLFKYHFQNYLEDVLVIKYGAKYLSIS